MLSPNLTFDVSLSGLDVVVMREVVDELYAFRDSGSGRSSRRFVSGSLLDGFVLGGSSRRFDSGSLPDGLVLGGSSRRFDSGSLLDGLVLGGSSRRFVSGSLLFLVVLLL